MIITVDKCHLFGIKKSSTSLRWVFYVPRQTLWLQNDEQTAQRRPIIWYKRYDEKDRRSSSSSKE